MERWQFHIRCFAYTGSIIHSSSPSFLCIICIITHESHFCFARAVRRCYNAMPMLCHSSASSTLIQKERVHFENHDLFLGD